MKRIIVMKNKNIDEAKHILIGTNTFFCELARQYYEIANLDKYENIVVSYDNIYINTHKDSSETIYKKCKALTHILMNKSEVFLYKIKKHQTLNDLGVKYECIENFKTILMPKQNDNFSLSNIKYDNYTYKIDNKSRKGVVIILDNNYLLLVDKNPTSEKVDIWKIYYDKEKGCHIPCDKINSYSNFTEAKQGLKNYLSTLTSEQMKFCLLSNKISVNEMVMLRNKRLILDKIVKTNLKYNLK